jgi:hypothetical protein
VSNKRDREAPSGEAMNRNRVEAPQEKEKNERKVKLTGYVERKGTEKQASELGVTLKSKLRKNFRNSFRL